MIRPGLADLHRHLDGSLRAATAAELAAAQGRAVPVDLPFSPGMGLEAALSRFAFTLSLLQSPAAVARVAAEICEDAEAEGVRTLELRFAPQLHRGATLDRIVDAALEGVAGRAGLVLCGLYGEDPAVLDALVRVAAGRPGVVGLDLAGGPTPGARWGLLAYAEVFARAGRVGLGRTVHAGEGRPAEEIRLAVERLGAERIGHGTTLLEDEATLELVLRRGVTIEACLSSNLHTGAIPAIEAHPLPRWLAAGVPVALCTDNTLLSATDAPREHALAAEKLQLDNSQMERLVQAGHAAAFQRG